MEKDKKPKIIEEVFKECASANECTGLYQRVHLDPKEVELFHKLYNEEE